MSLEHLQPVFDAAKAYFEQGFIEIMKQKATLSEQEFTQRVATLNLNALLTAGNEQEVYVSPIAMLAFMVTSFNNFAMPESLRITDEMQVDILQKAVANEQYRNELFES